MSEQNIFSSTGNLGTSIRPDGRLYHNAEVAYSEPEQVVEQFQQLTEEAEQMPGEITRVVFRGVVSDRVLETVADSPIGQNLEVAMPLADVGGEGWLIYLARNHTDRRPLQPIAIMRDAVLRYIARQPTNHPTSEALPAELSTREMIVTREEEAQLLALWGPTFGWSESEITVLAGRLRNEQVVDARERSAWFRAIYAGSMLVSAAMAERLTLPGLNGPLHLAESTEWRTRPGWFDHGLTTRNVIALNARIHCDLREATGAHIIFAECNVASGAYRAGYRAGFRVPDMNRFAAQIILQNVTVQDTDVTSLAPGLRDFVFMYAPDLTHGGVTS